MNLAPDAAGPGRRRRLAANAALAAAAFAGVLAALELVLPRLFPMEEVTLVHDPLLGFRGRPHASTRWTREMAPGLSRRVSLNGQGFHDHERERLQEAGTYRLVFLGDSFVEAYQVEVDSSFCQRLGRRLTDRARPQGAGVEAVNQGLHGYGLGVYALYVRQRLSAWHPDGVALCLFLGNDLHDNFEAVASTAVPRFRLAAAGGGVEYLPAPAGDLRIWFRDEVLARSNLGRFAWMRLIKASGGAMQVARAAGMVSTPDLEAEAAGKVDEIARVADYLLGEVADTLRARGTDLFVLVIPDPFLVHDLAQGADPAATAAGADRVRLERRVLATLARLQVAYLYPRDLFAERARTQGSVYRNTFGHFTDEAHAVVADLLEEPLWRMVAARRGKGSVTGDRPASGVDPTQRAR